VRCPSCMAENATERRFCTQCGAPLPTPCPVCGFENEPTAKFCGGCGKRIAEATAPAPAAAPAPPPGDSAERRQLTVMFCDLVGSTALSARLDPEDLREILAAYHRAVAGVISSFDGFVAKYMGDGVLAYFGYPRAHEDDAERAVRAGLGVIDAVDRLAVESVKLQARVGIATGLVVVGDLIGEGSAQEQAVVGETPNLAARLQALAEPGAVVIAASTRRLIGDLFEYRDLGAVEVKGIAVPVPVWQVLRPSAVASRFEALRGAALTPLVGRDEEIDLLLRAEGMGRRHRTAQEEQKLAPSHAMRSRPPLVFTPSQLSQEDSFPPRRRRVATSSSIPRPDAVAQASRLAWGRRDRRGRQLLAR
jgi:class 3 adenylate cyclase